MSDHNGNDDISGDLYQSQLFCECFTVSYLDIDYYLEHNKAATLESLQKDLKIGLGCGSCFKHIRDLNSFLKILDTQKTRS